ncbi:MAG: hypothetical protein HC941_09120 [Microcoleus sp. SU_5_3]|nr:hypothetical protein [Microcoleus sp. SU_5_3]
MGSHSRYSESTIYIAFLLMNLTGIANSEEIPFNITGVYRYKAVKVSGKPYWT